jgi:hypothetical protein
VVTTYLRHAVAELWGGPWTGDVLGHAHLVPPSWTIGLSGALLLALVGFTLQRGGVAARVSWSMLVVHVASSVALLALLGQGELLVSLGLIPRLVGDLAPVLVICAAGALSGLRLPPIAMGERVVLDTRRVEPVVAGVATVLVTLSPMPSTAFLAPHLYHDAARSYVTSLRGALADDPGVVLVDSPVPPAVMDPLFADRARVSEVVGHAPEEPLFGIPSSRMRMVTDDGTLAPFELDNAVSMDPVGSRAGCGYRVRADGAWIPLTSVTALGGSVVRLGYYTSAETFADVQAAGASLGFAVEPGLHVVYFQVDRPMDGVHVTIDDAIATLCVTNLDAGTPQPVSP